MWQNKNEDMSDVFKHGLANHFRAFKRGHKWEATGHKLFCYIDFPPFIWTCYYMLYRWSVTL
jgi:hypothetical protein